jgi:hypothetical protein
LLLADHYRLLREAFGSTGVGVRSEGDALFYVFPTTQDRGVRSAVSPQCFSVSVSHSPHGEEWSNEKSIW